MSQLGSILVLAALFFATAGSVLGFAGGARSSTTLAAWARRCAVAFALLLLAANVIMEVALLTPDFSVAYVAHIGSRSAPTWVRIVSLWSSLEGSILFWGAILGVYTLGAVRSLRKHPAEESWALGVLLFCGSFFALLIAGPATPFGVSNPIPADGPGPNPLLQNHLLMVVHPPMLYLGYVGMVVPFSLAIAALLSGRLGPAFLQTLRRWIMAPWIFLGFGIVLGSWWAYEVLGWGGYWGWDPVENAPLLPWLTATAAIHAALVVERRNVLRGWTVSLVVVTFLLTILGTFMTRSGIFNSVHAFAQSDIGPTFLTFLGFCIAASVVILSLRLGKLGDESPVDQAASREGVVVVGNLVLVLIMLTVLLGTVFPLVTEAVKGVQISVGEPYFNRMTVPMAVALLFLMGIGPALPWGRVSLADAQRRLLSPMIGAAAFVVIGVAMGSRHAYLLTMLGCAGFTVQVTFAEMFRPAFAQMRAGNRISDAWRVLTGAGRRRFGGFVAHVGLITIIVGVGVSSTGKLQKEVSLKVGESATIGSYKLTYVGPQTVEESNRQLLNARIAINENGKELGIMLPRLNYYFTQREPVGTPAVRSGLKEDLYLSAMNIDTEGGRVGLRAFVNPMVIWIWIGAVILALGGILSAWPRRSRAPSVVASRSPVGIAFAMEVKS